MSAATTHLAWPVVSVKVADHALLSLHLLEELLLLEYLFVLAMSFGYPLLGLLLLLLGFCSMACCTICSMAQVAKQSNWKSKN